MNKYDYIESIIDLVRGKTGINFQMCVKDILASYYSYKGRKFEMPNHYGGDDKNDGWVKEDKLFYQIYAPTMIKNTITKDIQDKFEEDLEGLLIKLSQGKWGGDINEFIFLVNTIDNNLPKDSDDFYNTIVQKFKLKYHCSFIHQVVNIDYLHNILSEINDINCLEALASKLRVRSYTDPNIVTEKTMLELITEISGNITKKVIESDNNKDYNRISTPNKISLNQLESKKTRIEKILQELDTVEDAISIINQDIFSEEMFSRVKDFIVDLYTDSRKTYAGVKLYDYIIQRVLENVSNKDAFKIATEFLIVYIFDKCDIFEKE